MLYHSSALIRYLIDSYLIITIHPMPDLLHGVHQNKDISLEYKSNKICRFAEFGNETHRFKIERWQARM